MLVVALASGCLSVDVGFSESDKPRYALPLLQTEFTLRDALDGFDFVGTLRDEDGLRLVRRDTIFDRPLVEAIQFDDIGAPLPDTVNSVPLSMLGVNLPLTEIGLATGRFNYAFSSNSNEPLEVELQFINISTSTQDTLTVIEMLAPGGEATGFTNLSGGVIRLDAAGTLQVNYTARTPSGAPRVLQLALISLDRINVSYAVGTLDNFPYDLGSKVIETLYLRTFLPNTASVRDASVTVQVTSTAPLPIRLDIRESYAVLRDGSRIDFATPLTTGVLLDIPAQSGDTAVTDIVLDETNSGLLDAVRQFPDSLVFVTTAVSNPDGENVMYTVLQEDKIVGVFLFDIPLAVDFDGFQVEEDFSFGELEEIEGLSDVELTLSSENLIGLNGAAQIYLLGDSTEVVDSLFNMPRILVSAAELDAEGNSLAPGLDEVTIAIDDAQLDKIRSNPAARIRLLLDTPAGDEVYARLDFEQSLALQVGITFTTSDQ